jgi:putative ABC transport system permease protein
MTVMDWRHFVRVRLGPLDIAAEREIEIVEELGSQLEATYQRARADGAGHDEALARAGEEVPDWQALAARIIAVERAPIERVEPGPTASPLAGLMADVRHAWRSLARSPGFVAAAMLTLGLGIGAVTVIYSLVAGILLKPLPIHDPDRVVLARSMDSTGAQFSISWPDFLDLQARARSVESLAAWRGVPANLTGLGRPRRLLVRQVTWNLLRVVGVSPALGRDFTAEDDGWGRERVCLISYRLWQQEFAGDPGVLGRTMILDDRATTIVGVLPAGFDVARREDAYLPLGIFINPNGPMMFRGNHNGLAAIGRLAPGATVEHARAEMALIAGQLEREHPATNSGQSATAVLLSEVLVGDTRLPLYVLLTGVVAMLLVACANLANLQLVRAAGRAQEIEVRLALGAAPFRIAQQLLVESLLVSLIGGAAGIVAAFAGFSAFLALLPADVPRVHEVTLDLRVLSVAGGAAVLAGILFGLAPALQAGRSARAELLRGARVAHQSGAGQLTRRTLVAVELALALALLAAGGLMVRSLDNLLGESPGFDADRLLSASVSLPPTRYTQDRWPQFFEAAEARLAAIPGVEGAAFTQSLPILPSNWNSVFLVDDRPAPARTDLPSAAWTPVSDGYFDVMGIRLLQGRIFGPADRVTLPPNSPVNFSVTATAAVVNESFARRFWPNGDAIGHRVKQGFPENTGAWIEIVGVVADVKTSGLDQPADMQVYLPLGQRPVPFGSLVIRTANDPDRLKLAMEAAIHEVDPDLPVYDIRTIDELLGESAGQRRVVAVLLAGFALLSVLVAGVGVFGVTAYGIAQRTHEFGVRQALGASPAQVVYTGLAQELRACAIGIGAGVVAALAATQALRSLLYGVTPHDPVTLAAVTVGLGAIAALGCYVPARRAARVDPAVTLRSE